MVGQITLTSSSKAAGTRRFTSGSWGCELGEELLPAFSLVFRRYQGAQGGALVVQLLVPPVFVGLGVYQQLGEPRGIADGCSSSRSATRSVSRCAASRTHPASSSTVTFSVVSFVMPTVSPFSSGARWVI